LNIRGEAEVRHAQRRGSVRKGMRKRLAASVRSWALDRARRRFEREWQDYQQPPELRLGPFFRRIRAASHQPQVFRSLIQVNFYPRPGPGDR
jgi:hypothetical protein